MVLQHKGSTSPLIKHLKTKHSISLGKRKPDKPEPTKHSGPPPPKKISSVFGTSDSTKVVLSRMVAMDGIAMNKFASSKDLRTMMASDGHKVPKSGNDIRNLIMGYSKEVREMYAKEMQDALADGELLSLTMDEWTSLSNRKYMNVNVHSTNGRFWGLGLARVFGSAPSERCRKIMKKLLKDFNLNLDNIASVTTDGARVMKKMGREIGPDHQICFAHGLHLAVCDLLYKKKPKPGKPVEVHEVEAADEDDEEDETEGADDLEEGFILTTHDFIEEGTANNH